MKNNNSTTTKFFKVFIALFFIQLFSLSSTNAQVTWLGEKLAQPTGISSDGSIIIGNGWLDIAEAQADTITGNPSPLMLYLENDGSIVQRGYKWQNGNTSPLPTLGGRDGIVQGISSDGSIIVGWGFNADGWDRAFTFSDGTMRDIDSGHGLQQQALGISSDGSFVFGWLMAENGEIHACYWHNGVVTDIGTTEGGQSMAKGISSDGSIIIGDYITEEGETHAFRWTASGGMTKLSELECSATGIVHDGSIIVGMKTEAGITKAFRWTESGGMRDLDSNSGNDWIVCGIVSDGSIIVGMKTEAGITKAFVWTTENGMQDLNDLYGSFLPLGSYLQNATTITGDGRYIVGTGFNSSTGKIEGFRIDTYVKTSDEIKFRTFKNSTLFSEKPNKIQKIGKQKYIVYSIANARDTIISRFDKKKGITLGVVRTDSSKKYGWVRFKKGADFGKFYTQIDTNNAYNAPFDTVRKIGLTKKKKFVKEYTPAIKAYTNPLVQEFGVFKLNLLSSKLGITPESLYALTYVKDGSPWDGFTLSEISNRTDSVLTMYNSVLLPTGNKATVGSEELESLRHLLRLVNEAFDDSNSRVNNGDTNYGPPWPVQFKVNGVTSLADVPWLKKLNSKSVELNFRQTPDEPLHFALEQNYPNPFNPTTTLSFVISHSSLVSLKIYNVLGQEVATLIHNRLMEEGMHELQFDASGLPNGVYFYRINVNNGEFVQTKKLVLMK